MSDPLILPICEAICVWSKNNEVQMLVRKGDGANWVNDFVKQSTYNENIITECLYLDHDGLDWVNDRKEIYTYDENNEVIEYLRQIWQNNSWVNDLKREYTYSYYSTGNHTEIMYLLFPRDNNWVYNQRIIYYYSSRNHLQEVLSAFPVYNDGGELFWEWYSQDLYYHNLDNNLYEHRYQRYDDTKNEWVIHELEIYEYYMLTTGLMLDVNQARTYELSNSYPNPFNPSTKIKYSIPNQSYVILKVFDVLGRELETLINKEQPQGNYDIVFNGSQLTSGIYFYRIQAGDFTETKKMILMQ